jgi:dipeptide transport system ATP-binding protein
MREAAAPVADQTAEPSRMPLLEVRNLSVEFGSVATPFRAVDGIDLTLRAGEVLGIVGESGSGKSVTALALMGLVDEPGRVHADRMMFDGRDLQTMALANGAPCSGATSR